MTLNFNVLKCSLALPVPQLHLLHHTPPSFNSHHTCRLILHLGSFEQELFFSWNTLLPELPRTNSIFLFKAQFNATYSDRLAFHHSNKFPTIIYQCFAFIVIYLIIYHHMIFFFIIYLFITCLSYYNITLQNRKIYVLFTILFLAPRKGPGAGFLKKCMLNEWMNPNGEVLSYLSRTYRFRQILPF